MKKLPKQITITVEKTRTGFSAFAEDLNVFTTAKNVHLLREHLLEALNLYYEETGQEVSASQIRLRLDLKQFFQYYRVINAKFLSERIGMNPTLLSQYIQGKKVPSSSQTDKILKGIHDIGLELSRIGWR